MIVSRSEVYYDWNFLWFTSVPYSVTFPSSPQSPPITFRNHPFLTSLQRQNVRTDVGSLIKFHRAT